MLLILLQKTYSHYQIRYSRFCLTAMVQDKTSVSERSEV